MRRFTLPVFAVLLATVALAAALVATQRTRADVQPDQYSMSVDAPTTGHVGAGNFTITASLEHGGVSSPDACVDDQGSPIAPAPHGCYLAAQWIIDFDEQILDISLGATARHPSAPTACSNKAESPGELFLGCLSLAGSTLMHSGIAWNIAASCIAEGTSPVTLVTGSSPETFVNSDGGFSNESLHTHNDSIECTEADVSDTNTPTSTSTPTVTQVPSHTPTSTHTRTPAPTPEFPLRKMALISPSACMASSGTLCLPAFGAGAGPSLFIQGQRLNFVGVLDSNDDGEATESEIESFAARSPRTLHNQDGALVVVVLVEGDGAIRFTTDKGSFQVGAGLREATFVCGLQPETGDQSLMSDEDCDADGDRGDGIVIGHLVGDDAQAGAAQVTVEALGRNILVNESFAVTGEPVSVDTAPGDVVLQAGLHPADCALRGPEALSEPPSPEKKLTISTVRDEDGVVTNGWVNPLSSDVDSVAVTAPSAPTLQLEGYGHVAVHLLCGLRTGSSTVTYRLEIGPRLGGSVLLVDPATTPAEDSVAVRVVGPPAALALTLAPEAPPCGDQAELTATARNGDGDLVLDGNPVTFTIDGESITVLTTNGVARMMIAPPPAGTNIHAAIPAGPATMPLDLNDNGLDDDNDNGLEPDGFDDDGDGAIDEPGDAIDEGDEVDPSVRVPNPNVITSDLLVSCTQPTSTPTASNTPTSSPTATETPTPGLITATPIPSATPPVCFGDVTGDGKVTIRDVVGVARSLVRQDPVADLNADGKVTLRDLLLVIKAWRVGACKA